VRRYLLLALVAALMLLPLAAGAVQSEGLGVYPNVGGVAWFTYHLAAGQSHSDSITVDNRTTATVDALVYPVDAAPNGDGGFGMQPSRSRPRDAGGWIWLSATTIHLPPFSSQAVGFSFTVPPRPSVGPHYAGIIVQPLQTKLQNRQGLSLRVITRLGVRIYETVPGQQRISLSIDSLYRARSSSQLSFVALLHNAGNTLVAPSGRLEIKPLLGHQSYLPINLGRSLQPDERATLTLPSSIKPSWLPGRYRVTLATNQSSSDRTVSIWTGSFMGWLLIVLLPLSFAAGFGAYLCKTKVPPK
jgi:hypothetical protein